MAGLLKSALLYLGVAATVFTFLWLMRVRERLKLSTSGAAILSVMHTAYIAVCLMVFAFLEGPDRVLSVFGAVFFLPLFFFLVSVILKVSISECFDLLSIPSVLMLVLGRVNCLIAGCCKGIHIDALGIDAPLREIELLFCFLFWNFVGVKVLKGRTKGEVYPFFVLLYGALRFLLDFARERRSWIGPLYMSHMCDILAFAIGITTLLCIKNKKMLISRKGRLL